MRGSSGHRFTTTATPRFPAPAHFCLALPPLGLPSDRVVDIKGSISVRIGAPEVGCLEVLLQEGGAEVVIAPDSIGETPIFRLARYSSAYDDGEEKAARDLLISVGALTWGVFSDLGRSPLMVAARYNSTRLARFLIEEAGAPVDELSPSDRYTALHRCGGDEMGALLLDAGAAADARADDGWTPVFQSASMQYIATTRMLLDRGASIDVITSIGATPFFFFFDGGVQKPQLAERRGRLRRSFRESCAVPPPKRVALSVVAAARSTTWLVVSMRASRCPKRKTCAWKSGAAGRWPSCWRLARPCGRTSRPACSRSWRR